MKSITKVLLLLAVALGMVTSWSYPVYALPEFDFESDESGGEAGLRAVIEGCYELIDGELAEVEELEVDKVYFISATLKNVAELKYWNPEPDLKYNDELYGIWFQFKLPTAIGHDTPGQVILESSASRRNYDDRWNKSEATIEVYAKDGQTLALEFAPGYCGIDTLCQINDYYYYMRSEEEYTLVHGDHDSEHPIASGSKRSILLAVRTRDSQEFAEKRALESMSHLRTSFMSNGLIPARSNIVHTIPIMSDLIKLHRELEFRVICPVETGAKKRVTVRVELPEWVEQQSNDQWWLDTRGKVYAEEGNVCFWAGLYNHNVIYDLDSADSQNLFTPQTWIVHLDGIEAWYLDKAGEKVALEVSEAISLPDLSGEPNPALILENNGISAKIALDGDLASDLAGKTIYIAYDYSRVDLAE